jgi:hypothetical protein
MTIYSQGQIHHVVSDSRTPEFWRIRLPSANAAINKQSRAELPPGSLNRVTRIFEKALFQEEIVGQAALERAADFVRRAALAY